MRVKAKFNHLLKHHETLTKKSAEYYKLGLNDAAQVIKVAAEVIDACVSTINQHDDQIESLGSAVDKLEHTCEELKMVCLRLIERPMDASARAPQLGEMELELKECHVFTRDEGDSK